MMKISKTGYKMTTEEPDGVTECETERISGDIYVFGIWGSLVKLIKADEIANDYNDILTSLPKGIYVVKNGFHTRKLIK